MMSLRMLAPLGRSVGAASELSVLAESLMGQSRTMAAAPSLENYVAGIRKKIAETYEDRAVKYDAYVSKVEELVTTTGVPSASDFDSVSKFAAKRAEILQQVNFPADWKVSGAQAEGIQALLKRIPAEKKAGADLTWYHDLSDAQIAQCAKNPSLFVEMEKVHMFEDQFAAASKTIASKYKLPALSASDLPSKLDLVSEHSISAEEAKWIAAAGKEGAEKLRKTDPRFASPFTTDEFKGLQAKYAQKFGISDEQLSKLQSEWTPEKWAAKAKSQGVRV